MATVDRNILPMDARGVCWVAAVEKFIAQCPDPERRDKYRKERQDTGRCVDFLKSLSVADAKSYRRAANVARRRQSEFTCSVCVPKVLLLLSNQGRPRRIHCPYIRPY